MEQSSPRGSPAAFRQSQPATIGAAAIEVTDEAFEVEAAAAEVERLKQTLEEMQHQQTEAVAAGSKEKC